VCWPSFGGAPQIAVSLSRKKRAYGFDLRYLQVAGDQRHRRLDQRDGVSGVEIGSNINGEWRGAGGREFLSGAESADAVSLFNGAARRFLGVA